MNLTLWRETGPVGRDPQESPLGAGKTPVTMAHPQRPQISQEPPGAESSALPTCPHTQGPLRAALGHSLRCTWHEQLPRGGPGRTTEEGKKRMNGALTHSQAPALRRKGLVWGCGWEEARPEGKMPGQSEK